MPPAAKLGAILLLVAYPRPIECPRQLVDQTAQARFRAGEFGHQVRQCIAPSGLHYRTRMISLFPVGVVFPALTTSLTEFLPLIHRLLRPARPERGHARRQQHQLAEEDEASPGHERDS